MKNLKSKLRIYLLATVVFTIASCDKSDSNPMPEISWASFFNFSTAAEALDIKIDGTLVGSVLPGEHSNYFEVPVDAVEIEVLMGSEVIMTDEFQIDEVDHFYSMIFYQNSGQPRLSLYKDYDLKEREEGVKKGGGGPTGIRISPLKIHHISSRIPDQVDVHDLNRTLGFAGGTSRYALMKAHKLTYGEMREAYVETIGWSGGLAYVSPSYLVIDSSAPKFSSVSSTSVVSNSSTPPEFNRDLSSSVPRTELGVYFEGFTRTNFTPSRGDTYLMVFYDSDAATDGRKASLINLRLIPIGD